MDYMLNGDAPEVCLPAVSVQPFIACMWMHSCQYGQYYYFFSYFILVRLWNAHQRERERERESREGAFNQVAGIDSSP
jgi:hypothetical protein